MTEKEDWGGIDPELQNPAQTNTSGVTWWTALDRNGLEIQIESASSGRTYFCPECEGEMSAAKGQIRAHHFKHKPGKDQAPSHCGGEGARHYRVKTVLHRMLEQIEAEAFRFEVRFELERRIGQDQPDIVVRVGVQRVLGIEIVDTNPPSSEKAERWGDRLFEIHIKSWSNEVIGDANKLSGKLMSRIVAFTAFTSELTERVRALPQALAAIDAYQEAEINARKSGHAQALDDLDMKHEEELQAIEQDNSAVSRNLRKLRETQTIWEGTWLILKEEEKETKHSRATWVRLDTYDSGQFPKPGEFVLIRAKKTDKLTWGVLGEELSSRDPIYKKGGNLIPFSILDSRPAFEFEELLGKIVQNRKSRSVEL
jgi:hypothetical protein